MPGPNKNPERVRAKSVILAFLPERHDPDVCRRGILLCLPQIQRRRVKLSALKGWAPDTCLDTLLPLDGHQYQAAFKRSPAHPIQSPHPGTNPKKS